MAVKNKVEQRVVTRAVDETAYRIEDFLGTFKNYATWFWAILRGDGNPAVVFATGEPRIAESWQSWRKLTASVDQDALICFAFAHSHRRPMGRSDAAHWGIFPVPDDREVRGCLNVRGRRIVDTHTHLEGCETAPYIWRLLCEGRIPPPQPGRFRADRAAHCDGPCVDGAAGHWRGNRGDRPRAVRLAPSEP